MAIPTKAIRPQSRQQQQIEELCAAAARALSNEPQLHYRGERLYRGASPVPVHASHLRHSKEDGDFKAKRGNIDAISLRLQYSDSALHQQLCPEEPVARLLFEMLEQFRVETFVPDSMPGMATNIEHSFIRWTEQFYQSGLADTHLGILLYTVALISRSRLTARPVPTHSEDFIEATRAAIVPTLGTPLAGLRRTRDNQQDYAVHALSISRIISDMLQTEMELHPESSESDGSEKTLLAFSLLLDFDDGESEAIATAASGQSGTFTNIHCGYQVYTSQYDREVAAASLVRKALLVEYRKKLDQRIQHQGINIRLLARQLSAVLNQPQRDGWLFGEEEGYIDGRRLSQLISSPGERRLFCSEQYKPTANSIVSFLIDCSGSMREHIENVTLIVDILVKALGLAGISSEVLGFTTNAWNGGKAYADWLKKGRPASPGRLNEACHLVFKDADSNWRHTSKNIAALLKADLFREGIDGEAIEWACQRMCIRPEEKRILLVISDGCPMDTATNLTNDKFYLGNHLKEVVSRYEQTGEVDILGLGVGLDLSPYYRRNLAIELADSVDNALFADIIRLIASKRR